MEIDSIYWNCRGSSGEGGGESVRDRAPSRSGAPAGATRIVPRPVAAQPIFAVQAPDVSAHRRPAVHRPAAAELAQQRGAVL